MYFQIIDNNQKCKKMYASGKIVDYLEDSSLTKTWKHSVHLSSRSNIEYAYLYSSGKYENACPKFLLDRWNLIYGRMASIMKSVNKAHCDVENTCIYDYVPEVFLSEYLYIKSLIIENTFQNIEKPKHYDILKKAHILTEEMNSKLNFYEDKLARTNYNIFGTKTGRLSNAKAGIPILTMKREQRVNLKPTNDLFVELDFNAAELRTLLALCDRPQPQDDIHEWNMQHSSVSITREEMKKRTFAWLYNPAARDSLLESLYDRDLIKDAYSYSGGVKTPFFREIETDERRSLNYIVQSTSSDICIEQSFKLRNFFRNRKTKVCYLLHDSVILDFDKNDIELFLEAKQIFGETRFGNYLVNSSIGKNFGEMRTI